MEEVVQESLRKDEPCQFLSKLQPESAGLKLFGAMIVGNDQQKNI